MSNFGYKQPKTANSKVVNSVLEGFFYRRFQELLEEQEREVFYVDYTPEQVTVTISNSLDSSLMIAEA